MRKHGGTPSRQDKHVTLAAISPPGVARGRFVGGQQSGLAGCKPPPLFTRGASSCSSRGRRQGEAWGASPRPGAPTYHTYLCLRLHPHPQIHGPHWSRPPGPRNQAGLPGLRTLPPPLSPGGLCGRHQSHGRAHPTRTPNPGPRTKGHPTRQRLTGRDHLLPLPQQPLPHPPP